MIPQIPASYPAKDEIITTDTLALLKLVAAMEASLNTAETLMSVTVLE